MNPKEIEVVSKAFESLLRRQCQLEARVDGLTAALVLLAQRNGIPQDSVVAAAKQAEDAALLHRLSLLEDENPGLAARLASGR